MEQLWVKYRNPIDMPAYRKATDAEVFAYAATLPEAEVVEWCEAHDSNWLDAPPIHRGCGWANELKPCVKAPGSRVLIPLPDKET